MSIIYGLKSLVLTFLTIKAVTNLLNQEEIIITNKIFIQILNIIYYLFAFISFAFINNNCLLTYIFFFIAFVGYSYQDIISQTINSYFSFFFILAFILHKSSLFYLDAIIILLLFISIYLFKPTYIGLGDIEYIAILTLFKGLYFTFSILFYSSLLALIFSLITKNGKISFLPFLTLITWLFIYPSLL